MKQPFFKFAQLAVVAVLSATAGIAQQAPSSAGLNPTALQLFHQPSDTWPTYNGDYSGRRFSAVRQITQQNIQDLKIKWKYKITGIPPLRGSGPLIIKSTPLMVHGVLYFTIPDHVFAVDARTGKEKWRFDFEDHGGHVLGQRGVGMYGKWIYFLPMAGSSPSIRRPAKSAGARRSRTRSFSTSPRWRQSS
jgi:alcohol dehydrogenase (cytochrome c)